MLRLFSSEFQETHPQPMWTSQLCRTSEPATFTSLIFHTVLKEHHSLTEEYDVITITLQHPGLVLKYKTEKVPGLKELSAKIGPVGLL